MTATAQFMYGVAAGISVGGIVLLVAYVAHAWKAQP